jgi:hypothetical protein
MTYHNQSRHFRHHSHHVDHILVSQEHNFHCHNGTDQQNYKLLKYFERNYFCFLFYNPKLIKNILFKFTFLVHCLFHSFCLTIRIIRYVSIYEYIVYKKWTDVLPVQFISSDESNSPQSLMSSHLHDNGIQTPVSHLNSSSSHVVTLL